MRTKTCNSGMPAKLIVGALLTVAAGCVPGMYVQKNVLRVAPTLSSRDICHQGVCVLPVWDQRTDTLVAKPSIDQITTTIRQKGHRQLKLVSFRKVQKGVTKQTRNPEILSRFQKEAFGESFFEAPVAFWKAIKPGYFLRVAIERGERVKLFNEDIRVTVVLRGELYHVPARRVVWQGQSVCKGKLTEGMEAEAFVQRGVEALAELLPVNPKVSYIKPKDESW